MSTLDFDPGSGTAYLTSRGAGDIFVLKLDASGNFLWAKSIGGNSSESASSITSDVFGNLYSTGSFQDTVDFDPGLGTSNLISTSTSDIFVLKMNPCMTPNSPTNITPSSSLTICYNSSTTLSATGSGTRSWYTAAVGGSYLGSGSQFTTGNLLNTTIFYVQDSTCEPSIRTAITITVNPQLVLGISSQINVLCYGDSSGTATVTATGGTLPYSYAWTPRGGSAPASTGLKEGTYICTIIDSNSCKKTQSVTISQPLSPISSSIISQTNVSCFGISNGAATVKANGGTGSYSYFWTPKGGITATASGLSSGTYVCSITDSNSCKKSQSVIITQPTSLNILTSTNGSIITSNANGVNYQWIDCNKANRPITGANSKAYSASSAGSYAVIVKQGSCSDTSDCVLVSKVGIDNLSLASDVSIYPNPSHTGQFTVELDKETELIITDALGQKGFNTNRWCWKK